MDEAEGGGVKKFAVKHKRHEVIVTATVPIKRIVNYYAKNKSEAARMRRVALSVLACVQWRGMLS